VDSFNDAEMVRTLKDTVCRGATDAQFKMFVEVCRATKLNPFLKEIWFVPNVGVMAGRDGYLRVANEQPQFDGMETLVDRDSQGVPIKATCRVWRKDRTHPITCEAYYNEYKKSSQVWTTYKSAMIAKVAEVLALKRSFSINGVVTEEEIGEQRSANSNGSHEAQQEVAQQLIAEGEKRAASKTKNFKMLKEFGNMKGILGTDDYYRILRAHGVDHANELDDDKGKRVYKAMKAYLNASEPLVRLQGRNAERFAALLAGEGYACVADALADADVPGLILRLELAMSTPSSAKEKLKVLENKSPEAFWKIAAGNYGFDEEGIAGLSEAQAEKLLGKIQTDLELGV